MWASHKLVVELAEDGYWFWVAAKDAHGTTMCKCAIQDRKGHGYGYTNTASRDAAQWTRVMTLPHSVAQSLFKAAQK
jgi:hypothetical protein